MGGGDPIRPSKAGRLLLLFLSPSFLEQKGVRKETGEEFILMDVTPCGSLQSKERFPITTLPPEDCKHVCLSTPLLRLSNQEYFKILPVGEADPQNLIMEIFPRCTAWTSLLRLPVQLIWSECPAPL